MRKRKILVLCLVLLAVAAAVALLLRSDPEELRQEVLAYIEAMTDLTDYNSPDVWDEETGRLLERHMGAWDAFYIDIDGSVTNATSLRRVFSVPELEPPVLYFGERIVGSGGMLYYLYPNSTRAIEISLDENDGYWLEFFAESIDNIDTPAKAYFREKMKQRVLKYFNPGDRDECSIDDYRIEIKTQEGLELLLRCIENANVFDMIGATPCAIDPPYVYVGGKSRGNDAMCGYSEGNRYAGFQYSNDDSEALREYIDAAFDAQTQ